MELYIVADNTLVSNKQCFAHTASPQKNVGVYINVGPKSEKNYTADKWHNEKMTHEGGNSLMQLSNRS